MEKSKAAAAEEAGKVDYRNEIPDSMGSVLPPAYDKPGSTKLKVAKIISATLLAITAIVGLLVVVGVYIHHGYQCHCDADAGATSQGRPVTSARIDRMDREPLSPESDVQTIPLPVRLELDATLGDIMKGAKDKKAEVNCVVETKRASQIITHDPKTLMTPFGNLTTDPKLLHFTGEKMTFSCISAIKGKNKSKKPKNKKSKDFLPRPRRAAEETCACDCAC